MVMGWKRRKFIVLIISQSLASLRAKSWEPGGKKLQGSCRERGEPMWHSRRGERRRGGWDPGPPAVECHSDATGFGKIGKGG